MVLYIGRRILLFEKGSVEDVISCPKPKMSKLHCSEKLVSDVVFNDPATPRVMKVVVRTANNSNNMY